MAKYISNFFYSQLSLDRRSKTYIMTNKIKTPPEDRIYDDDDGFFLRAASVCVRDQNESEVFIAIRKHYLIFLFYLHLSFWKLIRIYEY